MTKLNPQTRILVATAFVLAVVDIAVRLFAPARTVVIHDSGSAGVLTVRGLRVVDDNGNERASLRVDNDGEAGLILFDRDGTNRLQLDTWQYTPSLILNDREGNRSVYFGMDTESGRGLYQTNGIESSVGGQTIFVHAGDSPILR